MNWVSLEKRGDGAGRTNDTTDLTLECFELVGVRSFGSDELPLLEATRVLPLCGVEIIDGLLVASMHESSI